MSNILSFVCVRTIWIDVKLLFAAGGRWGTLQPAANEDAAMFLWKRTCIILYICIVPPLGASKSQLAGKKNIYIYIYILSLLFYTVNVYCDSIYRGSSHRVMLLLVFFACLMHSAAKFATTVLIKCVTHVGSTRCREPLGEYLSR